MGGIMRGEHPKWSWKLENPVDAFTVFVIAKQILGSAQTQPFCWRLTWKHKD